MVLETVLLVVLAAALIIKQLVAQEPLVKVIMAAMVKAVKQSLAVAAAAKVLLVALAALLAVLVVRVRLTALQGHQSLTLVVAALVLKP